jgi:hypothetical protein
MAWKTVDKYWLGYSMMRTQFFFYYRLQGESTVYQFFPSPQEFLGLSDMFRHEGPINYNTDRKYFVTAAEEIGEEETSP